MPRFRSTTLHNLLSCSHTLCMNYVINTFLSAADMGPLHDPVTWYKIIYTGEQVAQWDFQNNATRTSSPGTAFVLEVPLRNLLTSIYNFVPCDRIVQRAHCIYHVKFTSYCELIECSRPIRFFIVSLMYNNVFCLGQGQKSEQKPTTKNFVGFHNHSHWTKK